MKNEKIFHHGRTNDDNPKNILGENRGQWGKREGHWSFLFPRRGPNGPNGPNGLNGLNGFKAFYLK